jgi:hypothetical protein
MVLGTSSLTKGQASLFALDTSIQASESPLSPSSTGKGKAKEQPPANTPTPQRRKGGRLARDAVSEELKAGPVVVTTLAVACRRRLCLFNWRDGQWQKPQVIAKLGHLFTDHS